jgi:hypothetical protein
MPYAYKMVGSQTRAHGFKPSAAGAEADNCNAGLVALCGRGWRGVRCEASDERNRFKHHSSHSVTGSTSTQDQGTSSSNCLHRARQACCGQPEHRRSHVKDTGEHSTHCGHVLGAFPVQCGAHLSRIQADKDTIAPQLIRLNGSEGCIAMCCLLGACWPHFVVKKCQKLLRHAPSPRSYET